MEKEKPNYYAIIPANVRYDGDLTPNAKLLYGEITALTNQKGYCWASNKYFSKLYKVSKSSISSWISQLNKKNFIKVELIYKGGSKEISHRYIKILGDPIQEISHTPIPENLKDNNTIYNNTINKEKIYKKEILIELDIMFKEFWELYPNKKAKQVAYKSFIKLKPNNELFNEIMDKLNLFKQTKQWQQENGKYIPYPSTWLNQKRWEDEIGTKEMEKTVTDKMENLKELMKYR